LRPWLTPDTAPAAVLAAAAFFLTVIWPFWPVWVGPAAHTSDSHLIGRTFLELVVLLALAAPFFLVACSVGGRMPKPGSLALAITGLTIFGLIFRATSSGSRPSVVRWLIFAANLFTVGPLLVCYAASETLGASWPLILKISPLYSVPLMALEGFPAQPEIRVILIVSWAVVVLALGSTAVRDILRRRRHHSEG
jgi:hypothetical protein